MNQFSGKFINVHVLRHVEVPHCFNRNRYGNGKTFLYNDMELPYYSSSSKEYTIRRSEDILRLNQETFFNKIKEELENKHYNFLNDFTQKEKEDKKINDLTAKLKEIVQKIFSGTTVMELSYTEIDSIINVILNNGLDKLDKNFKKIIQESHLSFHTALKGRFLAGATELNILGAISQSFIRCITKNEHQQYDFFCQQIDGKETTGAEHLNERSFFSDSIYYDHFNLDLGLLYYNTKGKINLNELLLNIKKRILALPVSYSHSMNADFVPYFFLITVGENCYSVDFGGVIEETKEKNKREIAVEKIRKWNDDSNKKFGFELLINSENDFNGFNKSFSEIFNKLIEEK